MDDIIDDADPGEVLGSIHLRHELNDMLLNDGGHIGYGVRPSARGEGVATAALALCLEQARDRGIARALLVCEASNPLSCRTIVGGGWCAREQVGAFRAVLGRAGATAHAGAQLTQPDIR